MTGAFSLGRVAGVRVQVHWSVMVIFGLIAWVLSTVTLPAAYPQSSPWAHAAAGLGTAAVFLLTLLAHELSHAAVARHHGIEVDSITLWLFGGVAQLRGEAKDPATEFRIAGVGPLVSLALGGLFAVAAAGAAAAGLTGPLLGALVWLSAMNVLLAVFNVIPGAPLDGGRLLRAALWRWRGDRYWAAVVAARAGRALGLSLIVLGVWQFLLVGGIGGLWLAFLGWFLMGAATAEEQATTSTVVMAGVLVRDVMTPNPEAVTPRLSVAELVDRHLLRDRHSTYPLLEDGHLVGFVTLRRIKAVPEQRRAEVSLAEIACPVTEIPTGRPDEPLSELVPRLNRSADGRAVVLDGGALVGIVSPTDIARTLEHTALRHSPAVRERV